ncbi:MAG: hypothetical protein CMB00_06830 [Euryarchaeota archaeon]|nr:hypothetical protein [Euryarchaeota archaeon]DAC20281.1 MAG TPA: hypothetical protein D7H91_06000 [Candidatus Poseidoniales archaeon]
MVQKALKFTAIFEDLLAKLTGMPRRKYGRLRKTVELPPKGNCSRCRSGKHCPIEGHQGKSIHPHREWVGPERMTKRKKSTT